MQKAFGKYMNLVIAAAIAIVAMVTFAACSKDEPGNQETVEPGIPSPVTISIVTQIQDASTPANELINDYWIVFVNNTTKKIVKIIERPSINNGAVQSETIKDKMPSGMYTIYAFANISKNLHQVCDYEFKEGNILPDDFEDRFYKEPVTANGAVVPMTGFIKNVPISAIESNNIVVEVVRLVAKFNFRFYSDANQDITVEKIAINTARTLYIPLFPDYTKLDDHTAPIIPEGAQSGWFEYPLKKYDEEGLVIYNEEALVKANTPKAKAEERHFYVFESSAKEHPTGHYVLHFWVRDANGQSHRLEALLLDKENNPEDHVYRNDLIDIPVRFTNWNVDLDMRFYPPIGGYPTVAKEIKGDEFYGYFGSSGLFVIKPKLTDYNGKVYGYTEYTCDVTVDADPNKILARLDNSLDNAAEIVGEINMGVTGRAILNLEFRVKEDQLEHIFVRKLYIIRE